MHRLALGLTSISDSSPDSLFGQRLHKATYDLLEVINKGLRLDTFKVLSCGELPGKSFNALLFETFDFIVSPSLLDWGFGTRGLGLTIIEVALCPN